MILDREGGIRPSTWCLMRRSVATQQGDRAGCLARNAPQTFRSGPRASASWFWGRFRFLSFLRAGARQHPPGLGAGQALESLSTRLWALAGSDNLDNLDSLARPEQPLQAEIRPWRPHGLLQGAGLPGRSIASAPLPRVRSCLVPLPLQAPGRGHGKKVTQRTGVSTSFPGGGLRAGPTAQGLLKGSLSLTVSSGAMPGFVDFLLVPCLAGYPSSSLMRKLWEGHRGAGGPDPGVHPKARRRR